MALVNTNDFRDEHITVLAFRKRFTLEERVALEQERLAAVRQRHDIRAPKILGRIELPQKPAPKPDLSGPDMDGPTIRAVIEEMAARPAQLEGIWWPTNDQLVLGMGLLGGPVKSFYTLDIATKTISDKTDTFLPSWDGNEKAMNYKDTDWYRSVLK